MTARLRSVRARVRRLPGGALAWRLGVTALGVVIIGGGVVLLPLPGPGWVVIFAGLGLLATEYAWAARLLREARRLLTRWTEWLRRRSGTARVAVAGGSVAVLGALATAGWLIYQ